MPGLGIGILWFGYSVLYYGVTQVNSGTWGYLDLVIPSRWTAAKAAQPRDGGGQTSSIHPADNPAAGNPYAVEAGKPSASSKGGTQTTPKKGIKVLP